MGLISDITGTIAALKLFLAGMATSPEPNGETTVSFGIEVPDLFVLADVAKRLERVPGVIRVRRV
jgi:(p)ppGpp synthase/HD superfamily hydrolase